MGMMDTLGHALMDNDKLHFDTAEAPSGQEQWLVTLSAPLSAFNGDFVNAVATGKDNDVLREGIADVWSVTSHCSWPESASAASK